MKRLPWVKTFLILCIITIIPNICKAEFFYSNTFHCSRVAALADGEANAQSQMVNATTLLPLRGPYLNAGWVGPQATELAAMGYPASWGFHIKWISQDYVDSYHVNYTDPLYQTIEARRPEEYCGGPDPCADKGGDDDNDGICDDNDPCDGPNTNMIWKIIAQQYDSQGNICKRTVRIDCAGDGAVIQEKTIVYSESPDCDNGEVAIAPGDAPMDKTADDWLVGEEGEGNMYNPEPSEYVYRGDWAKQEGVPSSPATGIEPGIGSDDVDPADGDTGLLEGILDNTQAGNSNDQVIADYLKALNEMGYENGQTLERILDEMQGDGEGGDGSGGLAEAGQGVSDGVDGELGLQTAYGNALTEMQTPLEIPEEYQEKNTIGDRIEDLIENSPALNYVRGVSLSTSGNCEISVPAFGKTYELTMCQWSDALQAWGAVMEAITMLTCILIVFRRR